MKQSTDNASVLAAFPREWPTGSLKGMRAPRSGKVDMVWKQGRLTKLGLRSDHAMRYRVSYGDESAESQIEPGKPISLERTLRRISPRCGSNRRYLQEGAWRADIHDD
jgi:alpha-L-fucosidase 2